MAEYSEQLDSALPYKCKKCRKRFRQASLLQQHSRLHRDDGRTFTCAACHRAFHLRKQLWQHQRSHPSHRLYQCPSCKLHLPDALQYYRHRLKVHQRNPLKTRSHTIMDAYKPAPPLANSKRHSLKLCLTSKSKPGSWTVSPPKSRTFSSSVDRIGLRWNRNVNNGHNHNNHSGNLSGLDSTPSPSLACKLPNLSSARKCSSPELSSKSSGEDMYTVALSGSKILQAPPQLPDRTDFSAVVTSVDHSGASPKIKIEMSPRSGRSSPRSVGGWSPRLCGGRSPRVSSRTASPLTTRLACVSASSPTSIKIVFLKKEDKDECDQAEDSKSGGIFKRPRETDSPNLFACKRNLSDTNLIDKSDKNTGDATVVKGSCEAVVKPLKITLTDTGIGKVTQSKKAVLTRSESGESDELPQLEKVEVKLTRRVLRRAGAGTDSDEELCEEFEMPDDLSRHSSVDRYVGRNNTGTPVYDSTSVGSVSPPPLDRISEPEGPPRLAKMCCSGTECHKSLGALGLQCLGSPKDTGVSPVYLECGGAREEAASIGEGSPPSDVEQAGKLHDMSQFMLGNSSPSIPSPGQVEGEMKSQSIAANHGSTTSPQHCNITSPQPGSTASQTNLNNHTPPILPSSQSINQPSKKVSGFFSEFAKFVASKASQEEVVEDESESENYQPELNKCSKTGRGKCAKNPAFKDHELCIAATEDSLSDDKYNLRPKKRKAGHTMCECCTHLSLHKKVKVINARRLQEQIQKVLILRHRVCFMLKTVFPDLQYPEHFNRDSHLVESLMDQIIKAAREDDDNRVTDKDYRHTVSWDPEIVLCKSPRKCLLALRRKICCMLTALLPTLQLDEDFDRSSRSVDKLLEDVIYLNSV